MSVENEAVQDGSEVPAESIESGEPKGSVTGGESEAGATKREPSAEGLFDGMDAEKLHKSYKSLQGEYTKANEALKKFEKYGGPDQLMQWADYLSSNAEFSKWVQDQQNKKALGMSEGEIDPDQQRAIDAVRKIAESIVEERLRDVRQKEVAPLTEAYKQQLLDGHFKTMDSKYGAEWHEMRDVMSELSDSLPQKAQDNPSYEDIEDLYFKALRKAGKLDSYAKKLYEKGLTEKKQKSIEKPAGIPAKGATSAKTIQEAYALAKAAMNA